MKALVYQDIETLGFKDVPDAVPQAGEHLVKVEAAGICVLNGRSSRWPTRRRVRPISGDADVQSARGARPCTAIDFRDTAAALFDGHLGPLGWPQTRALAEGVTAFAELRAGKVATPKIILAPWL